MTVALRCAPVISTNAARFHLLDVLDRFAHLRAHPHEHAEQAGAGLVQTNVPYENMPPG